MCDIGNPMFKDEDEARQYLESIRWPDGPVCVHCGETEKIHRLGGKAHRPGVYQCASCRKQFTVTVGTLFERSKIPLHKWLMAIYLLCSSKNGISAKQLERTLGVTYKTAWFMTYRIREAMRDSSGLLGGGGGMMEIDDTYIGRGRSRHGEKPPEGCQRKEKVFTGGAQRPPPLVSVPAVNAKTLWPIIRERINGKTNVVTDSPAIYRGKKGAKKGELFLSHEIVDHSMGEYVRGGIHPIPSRTIFPFSRAASTVYADTSRRSISSVIWPSMIFGTVIASNLDKAI